MRSNVSERHICLFIFSYNDNISQNGSFMLPCIWSFKKMVLNYNIRPIVQVIYLYISIQIRKGKTLIISPVLGTCLRALFIFSDLISHSSIKQLQVLFPFLHEKINIFEVRMSKNHTYSSVEKRNLRLILHKDKTYIPTENNCRQQVSSN